MNKTYVKTDLLLRQPIFAKGCDGWKIKFMISVIIPTLNEENYIGKSLEILQRHQLVSEIIVSDGGSKDKTCEVAKSFRKVKWLSSERGRGRQMNNGAAAADSEILFFLHADSQVCPQAIDSIPGVLNENIAGSCYLKFDSDNIILNFYSLMSKANINLFTYGDQGLFLMKDTFNKLGGFPEIPIMEDYEMTLRLRKNGNFIKLKHPVITSARRFERNGVVKQQIKNILLVIMYKLGFTPAFISRFYKY